jgi:hypothetical protein
MQVIETLYPELEPQYRTRVYFGLGQNGQLKIGLTGRKDGRRGGEMHFTELCAIPGNRVVEARFHQQYAADRIGRTEWFGLSDRLLMDLIVRCVQQGRSQSVEILRTLIMARLNGRVAA